MKPVQRFAEYDYVCISDRKSKEEDQTVFTLQTLTVEQDAFLDDNLEGLDGRMRYGSNILHVCHMGIKAVKNFKNGKTTIKAERNKDGFEYPGKIRAFKSGFLDKLEVGHRRELAAKIRKLGTVGDDEAKNS